MIYKTVLSCYISEPVQYEEPLMASMLAAFPIEEQKQMLGETPTPTHKNTHMRSNTLLLSGIEYLP